LRDRVSELEKLRISAFYFAATGEQEKEGQTYELWIATYPRDFSPHANLGVNYGFMGQYEKGLAEYQEALRLNPDAMLNYATLAGTYASLDRLDEAKATLDRALVHKLDGLALRLSAYYLAFQRGNSAHFLRRAFGAPRWFRARLQLLFAVARRCRRGCDGNRANACLSFAGQDDRAWRVLAHVARPLPSAGRRRA
jgi:tetratricopeptide (TPR) repeat protein